MTNTNHSDGNLKKMFYSGVSFVAHSREILQKSADELSKHSKFSEADGKKIIDSALQKLEAGYNEAVHKLSALSSDEVDMLKSRISKLEKQLSVKSHVKKAAGVPTAKKSVRATTGKRHIATKKAKQ